MGFGISFSRKNNTPAANNVAADDANLPPSPKIGYRANKAIKVAMERRDSFKINEFGDVKANDFASVKLKHFEDKAALADLHKKAAAAKEVGRLLAGEQVDVVRESHGTRATTKPIKPNLGFLGLLRAKVSNFFNVPTKGRANRMQDEMELKFGRVVGNMLNLSHLEKSKEHGKDIQLGNANVAAAQKAVKESLLQFFEQRNEFVKAFGLDAPGLDGARNCDRQIVSRLIHSLENAGDKDSLMRLHKVADEWVKDWKMQANRGPADNVISIMLEIRNHIASRLDLEADSAKEAAPVQPENPVPEPPKPFAGLINLVNEWKSNLRSTLTKRVNELGKTCQGTTNEMKVFEDAFKTITDKMRKLLGERETDFSIDKLSVDAFLDVVEEMNTEIGKVIKEGKDIIDRLRYEAKGKVLAAQQNDRNKRPVYKEVDIKKTNDHLRLMLTNTTANSDKLNRLDETKNLREVDLDAKASDIKNTKTKTRTPKSTPAGAPAKESKKSKLLITPAMDAVNKAIEAFAAAKHELYHTIRPIATKLEGVALLAKKETEPPKNPNPPPAAKENCTPEEAEAAKAAAEAAEAKWKADWKDACNAVGRYLLDGHEFDMNNVKNAYLTLISNHKDYFIQGLGEKAKQRLELLFDLKKLRAGFDSQLEIDFGDLAYSCSSFDTCKDSTGVLYGEVLNNINNLEDAFAKLGNKFGVKRNNIQEIWDGELKDSCLMHLSPKVKIGVEHTAEGRQNGIYFDGNEKGVPIDVVDAAKLCWISNEDIKDLARHLFNAIKRVGGAFAQDAATELVTLGSSTDGSKLTEKRLSLIKEGKEYLEPLVKAYRDVRAMLAINALTRINDSMKDIRAYTPTSETKESWEKMCNDAVSAIENIEGSNVQEALDALDKLYGKIDEDASSVNSNDPGLSIDKKAAYEKLEKMAADFNANLRLLNSYGERGKGVMSTELGSMHLDRMVWTMDNLMTAEWRARDMENLVTNALESIPKFIETITDKTQTTGIKSFLGANSKWLKVAPNDFNIFADKLRKDFSDYAKSVKDYIRTLREDPLTSEKRKDAANAVREGLGACIGSIAPVMQLMADIEVFLCERFVSYDTKDYEHKIRSGVLVEKEFADAFVGMHKAVHNLFAALSEIGKGSMLDVRDHVKEDKLHMISGKPQYAREAWDAASEKILTVDYKGKRCKIVDHSVLAPVTKEMLKEGQKRDSYEMSHVRSTLMNEYLTDSTNLSASMLIRGSVSDEIFRSMENVCLMLSKAKQSRHGTTLFEDELEPARLIRGKEIEKGRALAKKTGVKYTEPPKVNPTKDEKKAIEARKAAAKAEDAKRLTRPSDALIGEIGRLVAQRTPIFSVEDLKSYLRHNKVAETEIAALDNEDNSDFVRDLVAHLTVLSNKLEVYEVKSFGDGWKEKQMVDLNVFLGAANVKKGYSITTIDITNNELTRVAVKNEQLGKEVYYMMKYNPFLDSNGYEIPFKGKIDFVPEVNTNVKDGKATAKEFKAFSVKLETYNVDGKEVKFPSEILKLLMPELVEEPKNAEDSTPPNDVEQEPGDEENPPVEDNKEEGPVLNQKNFYEVNTLDNKSMMDDLEIDQDFDELHGYGNGEE